MAGTEPWKRASAASGMILTDVDIAAARDFQMLDIGARQAGQTSSTSLPGEDRDRQAAPGCRRRCVRGLLRCATRRDRIPAAGCRVRRPGPRRAAADRTWCDRRRRPARRTPSRETRSLRRRAPPARRPPPLPVMRLPERRAWIAPSSSSVTGVSVSGSSSASSTGFEERWVAGSNLRIDSTSSPKNSMRTGRSASGEYTSRMPPRRAYSPGISTTSVEL